ncbi:MAG: SH3 domain-containing protein [Ardenticatenaceae bacterium]|nr:SH3 domain-containing protein [Ardenticatenaceae bacterium]MCB9446430.1 SH3 domain-containing protein [Ardenticatenaceae bacterium]
MVNKLFRQKNKWRTGLGAALLLVISILLVQTRSSLAADSTWQAKYWNNKNLAGDPVIVRQEDNIDHDWSQGAPGDITSDQFSARWKKTINFTGGTYRFDATMDDGMRIYLDGNIILDSWTDSQVHTMSTTVNISSGDHVVKVEYYDAGGAAVAKLTITTVSTTITQWRGEYFNNANLSGASAFVRNDSSIDFNWGGGSPGSGVAADNFSVRWTRDLSLDAGRYRFTTNTDDGVRLWVNNQLIIDKWFDQGATAYSAEIDLPGGTVPIRMEYYERVGGAEAHLSYTKISGGDTTTTWRGEYYNNKNLSGTPTLVRNDAHIDFDWGNGSPASGINTDNFSVRWTRTIYLTAGRYRFTANTDDGVRVWVNNQQIINAWYDHQSGEITGEIDVPTGNAVIKMEYYENSGGARARLTRSQISSVPSPTPIPATTGTATVNIYRLNVRQGPGTNYGIITTLNRGDVLQLAGYRNAAATWIKVILPNGTQGWLSAVYTITSIPIVNLAVETNPTPTTPTPTPVPTGATARVTAFYLNVRQGPDVSYPAITIVSLNQVYSLAGVRNAAGTWVKIVLANGSQGWVSARYVVTSVPVSSLPVGN